MLPGPQGQLVPRTPDLGGGAIRIASNRSKHIHFTLPYYDSGFVLSVQVCRVAVDPGSLHYRLLTLCPAAY